MMDRNAFLNREFISGLIWVVIGVAFSIGAFHYGIYDSKGPKPGIVAIIGGMILTTLGLVNLIAQFLSSRSQGKTEAKEEFFPEEGSAKIIFLSLFWLCVYTILLEYLGFFITSFIVMIFLLRLIEPKKWSFVLVFAFLMAVTFHILFRIILKIPFPRGYFGI